MLKQKNFKATFFIVPAFVGKKGYLDWDDIRVLSAAGMEIGSHSMTHPDFRNLSYAEANSELYNSKRVIESKINVTINSFAFPFGFAPQRFLTLAQEIGYESIMGSHHGLITGPSDSILPRNSIHSRMSDKQIKNLLNTSQALKLYWFFENTTKPVLKNVLPTNIYLKLRNLLSNDR
jgi:peptidoglycan/xylan/chitin deacetylase (PgdA/CDA1 family)